MATKTEKTATRIMIAVIIGIMIFLCVALWGAIRECRERGYLRTGMVLEGQELKEHQRRMRKHGQEATRIVFEDWQGRQWFIHDGQKVPF